MNDLEAVSKEIMEQQIHQESDLTGVMRVMNEDSLETENRLPTIDLKTRLQALEIVNIVIHDTVVALGCLPKECLITTRLKKRLAVSIEGKGREEMVRIVQGEREKQGNVSFGDKLKGLFSPAPK